MGEQKAKQPWPDRIRWWLYGKALGYCVRCMYPDADPDEFSVIDNANFVAVSRAEICELIEEAPEIAWHFQHELEHVHQP